MVHPAAGTSQQTETPTTLANQKADTTIAVIPLTKCPQAAKTVHQRTSRSSQSTLRVRADVPYVVGCALLVGAVQNLAWAGDIKQFDIAQEEDHDSHLPGRRRAARSRCSDPTHVLKVLSGFTIRQKLDGSMPAS